MKIPGKNRYHGFVILEILPALLLLTAFLAISIRLAGIGLRAIERAQQNRETRLALSLIPVRELLKINDVIMFTRSSKGEWAYACFPDESWLPADWSGSPGTCLWRTSRSSEELTRKILRWEFKRPDDDDWKWWCSIWVPEAGLIK